MTARKLVLPIRLDELGEARAWVARLARENGFTPAAVLDLELVVTEAVSNVVRHAYPEGASGTIELDAELDGEALTLRLRDWGATFVAPAAGSGREDGGYGLDLIDQLVDRVTRTALADGNLLELVKHREGGMS